MRFAEVALTSPALSRLHLVVSDSALRVAQAELDPAIASAEEWLRRLPVSAGAKRRVTMHSNADLAAPIASGSHAFAAMIVIPCSGGTLGAIANGIARDLLQRAADVCLKERRKLILVPRETPLSEIHLDNMLRVTRAGAIVLPASPGFYGGETRLDDLVDFVVARILDQLGVDHRLGPRYGEPARRRHPEEDE
jgi:4-hydroxy-3-polyprenylbenzoate decarboxylase